MDNKFPDVRFNRDIVECKDFPQIAAAGGQIRFNRDIVECKGVTRLIARLI